MPAGDRTGPMGMGPMTGRAAGYCGGYDAPGYANPGPRMGMGWRRGRGAWGGGWGTGWGRGRGWRHRYYATGQPYWARYGYPPRVEPVPPMGYGPPAGREDELAYLRSQAEWLADTLDAITSRIEGLEQEEA